MQENKKSITKKAGIRYGFVFFMVALIFMAAFMMPVPKINDKIFHENPEDDGSLEYIIWEGLFGDSAKADFVAGESGIESFFLLDYAQTPGTVLAVNSTDWSSSPNVHYYASASGFSGEVPASDPFYFVVRGKYNDSIYSGGAFQHDRLKCRLQVTGDETVDVWEKDNSSSSGDWVKSGNVGSSQLWGCYWWDDGVDGYAMGSGGSMSITVTYQSQYTP